MGQETDQDDRRLKIALEGTDTGVWEWDLTTDEVVWDERMERLFGYELGGFPGNYEGFSDRVHPEDLPQVEAAHERGMQEGFYEAKFRVYVDGETKRWVKARAEVVYEDDDPVEMIGIVTDITDEKETELRLKKQKEQLEEFASIVSHDIRTPMSVALGRLRLVREECDSDYLDEVERSLERVDEIVDDLLTMARQTDQVTELEPVTLSEFARLSWQYVPTSDATLVVPADGRLKGDPGRIKQLFENLFRNAIEHGGEEVTVTVGNMNDGFYVEDDGPGIPEGKRSQVLEHGYSTSQDGTGFGLSIVSQIAEAHDWDVRVTESTEGGARIELTGVEFTGE